MATLAILGLGSGCLASRGDFTLAGVPGKTVFASDEDWASTMVRGRYRVFNNPWNKGATSGRYRQKVFVKDENGSPVFGWVWKWRQSTNVATYPEVLVGHSPWQGPISLDSGFPFQAGTRKLIVDYDVTMTASGAYNLAFEFWTVSALPVAKDRISHEVMIWLDSRRMAPAGSPVGTATIDGKSFAIYESRNHGDASGANSNRWAIISLVAERPLLNGPLDVGLIIDHLLAKGLLGRHEYVTDLELGNEVTSGAGTTAIRNYDVRVEPMTP